MTVRSVLFNALVTRPESNRSALGCGRTKNSQNGSEPKKMAIMKNGAKS